MSQCLFTKERGRKFLLENLLLRRHRVRKVELVLVLLKVGLGSVVKIARFLLELMEKTGRFEGSVLELPAKTEDRLEGTPEASFRFLN